MNNILKARITRNGLIKNAKIYYVDETSELFRKLINQGKSPLVGICKSDSMYTVLGKKHVYYKALNGSKNTIPLVTFDTILHKEAMRKGKLARFRYLQLNKQEKVWLHNKSTMLSLWNTMLYLEQQYTPNETS